MTKTGKRSMFQCNVNNCSSLAVASDKLLWRQTLLFAEV